MCYTIWIWKQKTSRRNFSCGYSGHLAVRLRCESEQLIWIIRWHELWSQWRAVWADCFDFQRFSTVILLPVLVTLLLRIITTNSALHQTINVIQEQLKGLGYSISSPDNFENSLRCDACQVTLKFQKSFQAVWLLKRHTGKRPIKWKREDTRRRKQRTTIKPKGKLK